MKKSVNLVVLLIVLSTTGCSSVNNRDIQSDVNIPFEIDELTQRKSESHKEIWNDNIEQNITNSSSDNNEQLTNMGELKLNGNDTSISYEISDNNIIYNGITYYNLYSNINQLNSKYDKNTLINFIIKNYNATSSEIYTNLIVEEQREIDPNAEIEEITFDEQLGDNLKYIELKEQYNENVSWALSLMESDTNKSVMMYGCNSYILLANIGSDVVLDMNELDSNN